MTPTAILRAVALFAAVAAVWAVLFAPVLGRLPW